MEGKIINIRGTSGAGKSTMARRIMALYEGTSMKYKIEGRRQPIGYSFNRALHQTEGSERPLAVIGHYETPCGGCDTISTGYEGIFQRIRDAYDAGMDVFFEGLLITVDVKHTTKLHSEGYPIRVISLTTPLEQCLENINKRRRARNPELGPVNPKNTTSKHRGIANSNKRLIEAGVPLEELSFDDAFLRIRELLNV